MRQLTCKSIFLGTLAMTLPLSLGCTASNLSSNDTPSSNTITQKISHEQQWIVNFIGEDVAEIILFAAKQGKQKDLALDKIAFKTNESAGSTEKFTYELICPEPLPAERRDFTLENYVWSPANYSPWAEQLIESFHLHDDECAGSSNASTRATTSSSSADSSESSPENYSSSFISNLLGFTPESISQQNTRISSALTSHPLDAQLHQQAALLLSLFALRESAACFNDLRPALNRISAHLAIASAINGKAEYGAPGKLAEIALMTMGGHEAEAVRRIDSLMSSFSSDSATNDSVRSWLRALKIRATHDYRIADLKKASALERLEYGRALADDVGSDYLTEYLQNNKPEGNAIDWLRIGSRGVSTVESGHIYTEPGVQAEFESFAQDFKLFKNKSIGSSTDANEALDLAPDRCLIADQSCRLQVISWADVAAFHARHILDSWFQKYYFEEKHWGVHEDAQNFAKSVDKTFSKLKLYPLFLACRLWVDVKTGTPEQTAAYKELMDASPQEINSTLWHRLLLTSPNAGALPKVDSWFTPRFLYGTAFDFNSRNWEQDPDVSMAELDRLKSESPYDSALLRNWAGTKYPHDTFTSAQIKEAYGVQAEVNVAAMEMVAWASRSNPATYAELMEKVAEYKPDKYFELGNFYVEHKQFDKAKIAYEAGVKLGRDDVLKSNSCSWLVNYYYDHGRKDDALKLATFAADRYSSSGLTTMAKLCERMGKFSEAEKYFLAIQERYNNSFGLCLFYRRHADNKDYKQKGDVLEKNIFPEGLKKVDITNIKEAPDTGILITVGGDLTEKYGLKVKEIIVAVNGIQVKTREQYHYMLNASPGTKMQFVVWNGNAYRTLEADLPDRRWGCQIRAYHPKHPKQED